MAPKAVENAGPGTAGVDERRRPASSRHLGCVDTEGCPAPIDMRVEINEPWHDKQTAQVDGLDAIGGNVAADFTYLSIGESDVGRLVAAGRRVDDAPAFEHQIITRFKIVHCHLSGGWPVCRHYGAAEAASPPRETPVAATATTAPPM